VSELAQTFLSLTPESRQEFMNKLADSGSPQVSDWLAIFAQYHQNLENQK
jgi:hypothetical protein